MLGLVSGYGSDSDEDENGEELQPNGGVADAAAPPPEGDLICLA